MSIGKKLLAQSAGLAESLERNRDASVQPANKSAPAQLMAFRGEMSVYERKIAELEKRLADGAQSDIPLIRIEPNPWQPRQVFDENGIESLAKSIAEMGLIQPIIVRSVPSRDTFQLVTGERRCRAHQFLGLESIKAVVIEASDTELAVMALAENIDRQDLSDYEIAKAIRRMESEFPSKKKLAESIGVGRQDLYKYLAFEKLPAFTTLDLERNPGLLGRNAAERIVRAIAGNGDPAIALFAKLWRDFLGGKLEQGDVAGAMEQTYMSKAVSPKKQTHTPTLLTVRGKTVGSMSRSSSLLTIKIKVTEVGDNHEARLKTQIETLLAGD